MSTMVYFPNASIHRPDFLRGNNWELQNLHPITVLFGKNGSGKSLLLRSWRDSNLNTTHYVIPERTGDLGYNPTHIQSQSDPRERREQSSKNYSVQYRQQIVARIQAYFMARGAVRSGQLPGNVEDLEQLISILLPDFSIELLGATPPYRLRRIKDEQEIVNVDQLSSGEAQLFTLSLDILERV